MGGEFRFSGVARCGADFREEVLERSMDVSCRGQDYQLENRERL